MEKLLSREGLLPWRSQYASLGGIMETGGGLDGTGYALGNLSILSHGAQYLPENGLLNLVDDIDRRWRLYFEGAPPKAFINVGGGITPLGWIPEAALLDNGLLKKVPATDSRQRGLIFKMFEAGVPVIHLLNIERLAATQHLPISPKKLSVNPNPEGIRWRRFGQIALTLVAWLTLSALWAWRDKLNLSPAKKH
jgi:poly-gamma-glutamate system protein